MMRKNSMQHVTRLYDRQYVASRGLDRQLKIA